MILAAQAFSAVLPLFIVVSTISPHPGGDSPATVLAGKLGLGSAETSSLQVAVIPPPSARTSIGIPRRPRPAHRDQLRPGPPAQLPAGLAAAAGRDPPPGARWPWWSASPSTSSCCSCSAAWSAAPAGSVLEDLVTFAGAWALWTGAGWILLAGRVRPRLLAAGGC